MRECRMADAWLRKQGLSWGRGHRCWTSPEEANGDRARPPSRGTTTHYTKLRMVFRFRRERR